MKSISLLVLSLTLVAHAQWQMQTSGTSAGLRGIHAVNDKIAWASGTEGTILHTTDAGAHWQKCAVPPDGEKLDFRGVQAWDSETAVILSSGPGELSRVYRTTDACAHWTEIARNKNKDGFWDTLQFPHDRIALLVGDPIDGHFDVQAFYRISPVQISAFNSCTAQAGEGAFAASNSSAIPIPKSSHWLIGTGGLSGPRILTLREPGLDRDTDHCSGAKAPLAAGESAGVFSLAMRDSKHGIAVGGDYKKPAESAGTAAWTEDGGTRWKAADKPPRGYRSAVAWNAAEKFWIAAGPTGSDISRDDGKTWQPLDDGNWNALSLPFAVGPDGRIATLSRSSRH